MTPDQRYGAPIPELCSRLVAAIEAHMPAGKLPWKYAADVDARAKLNCVTKETLLRALFEMNQPLSSVLGLKLSKQGYEYWRSVLRDRGGMAAYGAAGEPVDETDTLIFFVGLEFLDDVCRQPEVPADRYEGIKQLLDGALASPATS